MEQGIEKVKVMRVEKMWGPRQGAGAVCWTQHEWV